MFAFSSKPPLPSSSVDPSISLPGQSLSDSVWSRLKQLQPYLVLVAAILCLPFVYAYGFLGILDLVELEQRHLDFIALCTVANVVCGAFALRGKGRRLSRRIESAFLVTLGVHSLLLLVVAGLRLYYSRPVMLSAFLASFFIAISIALLMERNRPRRIGIVPHQFSPELLGWIGPGTSVIPAPNVSPRAYDVVLFSFEESMDVAWTRFVSNALLSGCEVRHMAEVIEELHGRVSPDHFAVEHAGANPAVSGYLRYKRVIDVLAVMVLAPVAIPVAAIAALMIKRSMGGNALFTQERAGLGGKPFIMYKLRTMRDRLPGDPINATEVNDPRITPLGHRLRRYRIDELPQLWNVLIGDMSLIGPRPEQVALARKYAIAMPAFEYRLLLRPGITGWAQVRAGYAANEAETREKLSFDLYYAKYVSARLDVQIAVKTLFVLGGSQQVR